MAFVGSGAMARQHLHALRHMPTAHAVVGVQDANPGAAAEFAARAGATAYPTLETLLAHARPELVHICTPAGRHFEPARAALLAGAHVYVEKPLVETSREAAELLEIAQDRRLLVCAGHQLVRDPTFTALSGRTRELAPVLLVDSYFAFRSPRLHLRRSSAQALAEQLLDVVPHPLSTLVAALECVGPAGVEPELAAVTAIPSELHALVRVGDVAGRLCVSLRARPVASTLTCTGAHGSLTADFVRATVVGAANEGTSPIEKIVNPFLEAGQAAWRTARGLTERLLRGSRYPGLAELLRDFYAAAATSGRPPLAPDHLRRVTRIYEQLAAHIRSASATLCVRSPRGPTRTGGGPLVVVTGAGGFLGRAICRELARRGFRVRGLGRSVDPGDPKIHDWIRADLGSGVPPEALAGASAVVHAAAETAGGFEAHERNTVAATRNLLAAMTAASVPRLVHVSSLSVLRPPRTPWERQDERTPLSRRAESLGPYTWGKRVAEAVVARAHAQGAVAARIIRPAALVDWEDMELPGLVGRRLFGRWHLGLGRPGLPFAACDVRRTAAVIAWCVDRFEEAPAVLNVMDPDLPTRGRLVAAFRARGWRGRVVWVPVSLVALFFQTVRMVVALARLRRPERLAVWAILRSRRYDMSLAAAALRAAERVERPVTEPRPARVLA